MLDQAHQRYGAAPWASLFEDAIRLSDDGFEVSERLHTLIAKDKYLKDDPTARAFFYTAAGDALPVGSVLKNPEFADTLRQIQAGRSASFYLGQIADEIVAKVQNHPSNAGVLSVEDMQRYQAIERTPVCMPYSRYTVCGMDLPSSGGLTVYKFWAMEAYRDNRAVRLMTRIYLLRHKSSPLPIAILYGGCGFCLGASGLLDPDYLKAANS